MSQQTTTTETSPTTSPLRVIFFGMTGVFSRAPLLALWRAGDAAPIPGALPTVVCAVVLPTLAGVATPRLLHPDASDPQPAFIRLDRQAGVGRPRRAPLPMAASALARDAAGEMAATMGVAPGRNIVEIAAERGAPIFEVARLADPRTLAALAAFAPDVICVACFSRRLPSALLRLPRLGCLNVHPSLLPANRGPDPLFWSYHQGDTMTGVTIHLMDERLDTGPIVLQQSIPINEGVGEATLEAQLAALGGELLARAVVGLASGALQPIPQDDARASAHPWPTADDYVITASDWSARRAYRFARGVAVRGQPITLVAADGARFRLRDALDYADDYPKDAPQVAERAPGPSDHWRLNGDDLWLRCTPGVLHARVTPEDEMAHVS